MNKESIRHEQTKDDFCIERNPGTISRKCEFFQDHEGVIFKRHPRGKHQIVIPRTLIQTVIKENHDPVYVAHPGTKRTYDLISLNYWWPRMRRSIEEYIRRCDSCQRQKEDHEFVVPLGKPEEPTGLFSVTSMDVTGPYPQTERKNIYLLPFIDHFTKFVEAFPIPDQTAETCARVYATQITTQHSTARHVRYWAFKKFEPRATTPSQTAWWNASTVFCIQGCCTKLTPPIQIGTC